MTRLTLTDVTKDEDRWRGMAVYLGARGDQVDDCLQEMYLKLGEKQEREGDLEALRGTDGINAYYVFRVIQSCIVDEQRARAKMAGMDVEISTDRIKMAQDLVGDRDDHYQDLMDVIRETLDDLEDYDLMILELYFVKDYSIRAIAKGTGIGQTSIFNTLKNIKTRLRNETQEIWDRYCEAKAAAQEDKRIRRSYRDPD